MNNETSPSVNTAASSPPSRASLSNNEELFRLLIENVEDYAVFIIDTDGNAASWNPGVEKLLGYTESDFIGRDTCDIFTPEDNARKACQVEMIAAARDGRAEDRRWHVRKDGSRFWANGLMMALKDDAGKLRGFAKIMRDDTERKLMEQELERRVEERTRELSAAISVLHAEIAERESAEAALHQEREFLSALLESIEDGIVACDAEGRLTLFNRATREFHGLPDEPLPPEEWAAHYNLYEADGVTPLEKNRIPLYRAWHDGQVRDAEMVIRSKAGITRMMLASGRALFDAENRKMGAVVSMHDVTAQRRAEAERLELAREQAARLEAENANRIKDELINQIKIAEERYRSFVTATSTMLWSADAHGNIVEMPDWYALTGQSYDSLKGWAWLEALHPDDREPTKRLWMEAVSNRSPYYAEFRILSRNGIYQHFAARAVPVLNADGMVREWIGASSDINERKEAEVQLRESEERYRTLFTSMDEGFCVIEMMFDDNDKPIDYRFVEFNSSFERLTGIPVEQASSGKTAREIIPNLEEHWFETYGRVALTGEPVRFVNESEALNRWFDVYAFRIGQAEQRRVALLFYDITERKRSEVERERLLQSLDVERSRLADIFTKAPAFVAILRGAEHVFEMVNPAYLQMVGHRDLIGKSAREAFPDIKGQGFFELLDKVFRTGEPYEGREIGVSLQREPQGSMEERFVDLLYQPLYEADGTVSGIFAHGVDITEQVEARRKAENANRLKDEFLATLSHELRTPLTSILGWSRMLRSGNLAPEPAGRALEIIERNAQAQNALIGDILDVSSIITGKLRLDVRAVELSSVIEAAADAVRPAAEAKHIKLQVLIDPSTGQVSGDSDRLQQVVWNLLTNAVKFTPKGGRVQVRLECVNSHVEITVSDSGQGIPPEFLPFVFDRFRQADQNSTRIHGGLGLGLSIVKQLVEMHGGTVSAGSAGERQGTIFTVALPRLVVRHDRQTTQRVHPTANTSEPATPSPDCPPPLEGLHVLVVDDEADTRELLRAVLEGCGSQVSTAASAAEALTLLETTKPDVLLSDIGMPNQDGYALIRAVRAREARENSNRIPAVALTAYARVEDRVRALKAGFQVHVPKPIEPVELTAVVASLVNRYEAE